MHHPTPRRPLCTIPRLLAALAVTAAVAGVAACGSSPTTGVATSAPSTPSAATSPADSTSTQTTESASSSSTTASPSPTASVPSLSVAAVQAVVQRTFPAGSGGVSGGCTASSCPFTARLTQQLAHLASQTPSPTHSGDVCNYDLVTGNQAGITTPASSAVQLSGDHADAVVSNNGQSQPIVTLVVVDSAGTALVDDILYNANAGRSVYSLSCTGSIGG